MNILVAGIGNIFHGDDAFGVEVARELLRRRMPERVRVVDFGIRSYDLAYAIMDGYDAAILVDTTQRGRPPGTLYLLEPDRSELETLAGGVSNGHGMNPLRALRLVHSMDDLPGRLYLIGCEPAKLDSPDGTLGLTAVVQAAVARAVDMIGGLIDTLIDEEMTPGRSRQHPLKRDN